MYARAHVCVCVCVRVCSMICFQWNVFTDNRNTLTRSFYVCGLECRIDNAKDLSLTENHLPWLLRFEERSWDGTKSRSGPDTCSASSFINWAKDSSFVDVTLSCVALRTFRFSLVICTRSLDVHALRFFFLGVTSVDGNHIGSTVNKMHVV